MTMKRQKTLHRFAAVAAVLLTLCLVFMMPVGAESVENCNNDASCSHVAAIGTTHYDTLAEAITAANSATSDVTIELLRDAELVTGITINNSNNVDTTINGNNYNKIIPADGASFNGLIITVRTNLTITSTNISGFTTTSDIVNAYKGADLTLKNCIFKENSCRSVVRAQSGYDNTVILENTVFNNNNAAEGIVYSGDGVGTYMITNCEFGSNTCYNAAAPVALPGSVSITGSTFTNNEVTSTWSYAASAAYCWGSDVDITDNTITGNKVKATGATAAAALIVKTGENDIDLSGNAIDDTNVVQTRETSDGTFVDAADAAVFVRASGSGTVTIDSGTIVGTVASSSSSQGVGILITGGTFSTDVSEYVADSYVCIKISETKYIVANPDYTIELFPISIPAFTEGETPSSVEVAVINKGNLPVNVTVVEFDKAAILTNGTLPGPIAGFGGIGKFTLTPVASLKADTYTVKITVATKEGGPVTQDVTFTVNAKDTPPITPPTETPDQPAGRPTSGGGADTGSGNYNEYPRQADGKAGEISFGTSKTVKSVDLPAGVTGEVKLIAKSTNPGPEGKNIFHVFEINIPNYPTGEKATIKFEMTLAEIEAKGLTAADVCLYHFNKETGLWEKLPTTYKVVDGKVYFESVTTGFSPFAIVFEEGAATLAAGEDKPVTPPTETPDVPNTPGTLPPTDTPDTPETPASPAPILAVLAGLGAVAALRRK